MCIVLTTGPPGNLPQRLLLLKEYIYFLSCLLWHLFVSFTSCMFLFYFSFLWELSLTLVNRFSNNIGFLHTNTLHFLNVFIFGCTGSLLLQGLFATCGRQGLVSTCSAQTSHSNAFSCYSVLSLCLCTVVVTPKLWNTELWPTGLGAPKVWGNFPDEEWNSCALITRWILYLWARREAPKLVPWHVSWNQWT